MSQLTTVLEKLKTQLNFQIATVELISARVLENEVVAEVRSVFGEKTRVSVTTDTAALDGLRIKIGDIEFDASSQAALDTLEKRLQNADDLASIRSTILGFQAEPEYLETGTIISIKDGVAFISGLWSCEYFEELDIGGVTAIALSLEKNQVGAVILGDYTMLKNGDTVKRTRRVMSLPVSEAILGRVVSPTGQVLDGDASLDAGKLYPVERIAPGVMQRQPVDAPLQTGIRAIDAMIPIGQGQRELILGDRQTGKTTVAIDTIINQKGKDIICIYVAIGQKNSKVARTIQSLKDADAMSYSVIVSVSASESAGLQFLAPYTGTAIAEFFMESGKNVLIVYDDLSKHAVAYRELSLLLKRPPGREAYPGDVFYLHSRLLERSARLNSELGGGSITSLPIIETVAGDISAYIPTNVISITDGQIFLESDLFYKGQRPAINVGSSVSRVGGAAQTKAMKKVAGSIKLSLAQFREVEAFAQFSSDLDEATLSQIKRGKITLELLKQTNGQPQSLAHQVVSLYALKNNFFNDTPLDMIKATDLRLVEFLQNNYESVFNTLNAGKWSDETENELNTVLKDYRGKFGN